MRPLLKFLHKRAEDVMVALVAVMFTSFIIQIAARYIFNAPTDWTHELILITWVWLVFWGAAFFLEDKDHVKFDVLYNMFPERIRRRLALISAVALGAGFLASVPATWDFISFKKIRASDTLHLRFDIIFGIYLVFLVSTILHYALRAIRLVRGDSLAKLEREEQL
jgi:TRAP-type C4-dicarboxylate transport system permease small subunit